MNEHEIDLPGNQRVLQPRQSLQLWLMVDGQLVVLTHRRHPVPHHIALAGFAEPMLRFPNHQLHRYSRQIFDSDTILDDVTVWRSWLSILHYQNE